MNLLNSASLLLLFSLSSCAMLPSGGPVAPLAVERFEIVARGPAFAGTRFDDAGDYELVTAVAHMRIDPRLPANRGIVDLGLAPVGRDGLVRYKTDVLIARPRDASKASGVMVVEAPNRGNPLFLRMVNEGNMMFDNAAAAGTGFTMRRGHTMVWVGWQGDLPLFGNGKRAGAAFPVATAGGKPITGESIEEQVFDDAKPVSTMMLDYPAASQDQAVARLTVRATAGGEPTPLPASAWRYTSANAIEITRPRGFDAGAIYQFQYLARDPKVMGLGLAAFRDVGSFLKSGAPDGTGQANPLADIKPAVALAVGVSQSGRFLRDLVWEGFNADARGGKVYDGAMVLIAGARKAFINARFAQPARNSTQHIEHLTPGDQFPFSYAVTTDPLTGRTDGIFARCEQDGTCPKLMHIDSSVEFWQGRASLIVTNGAGKDVPLPADVRAYLMSSTQHIWADRPAVGICKYQNNPAQQAPTVRVLLDHLASWARSGQAPPASRYPRLADAMLVPPERDAVGFPDLGKVGVAYPAVINHLDVVDYSVVPPRADPNRRYQLLVPMADIDGHDIAGVRLPDVAVPLATHAGWNLRRSGFAQDQLCGLNGVHVALPATPVAGDPRRAISERYRSRLEYAKAVAIAARALRDEGLLLDDDTNRFIERAKVEPRVKP